MKDGSYRLPLMDTINVSWSKVSGAKEAIWAVFAMFLVIQIVIAVLMGMTTKGGTFHFFFNVISALIQFMASLSLIYLGIRRAQNKPIHYQMIKDVLTGRFILYIIGVYFLQVIILIPPIIIAGIGGYLVNRQTTPSFGTLTMSIIFFIVGFVLLLFLMMRTGLAYGAIVDKEANPMEAIRISFLATKGNVLPIFGSYLIGVCIMICCVITLGIGFIWGIPWVMIIYGEIYNRLITHQSVS